MATGVLLRPHANPVPNPDETASGGGVANPPATAATTSISVFPARRGGLRLRIWHHHVLHLLSELPKTGCHDPEREGSDGRNVVPN